MKDFERWDKAIKHADKMLELYKSIPAGGFGVIVIQRDEILIYIKKATGLRLY